MTPAPQSLPRQPVLTFPLDAEGMRLLNLTLSLVANTRQAFRGAAGVFPAYTASLLPVLAEMTKRLEVRKFAFRFHRDGSVQYTFHLGLDPLPLYEVTVDPTAPINDCLVFQKTDGPNSFSLACGCIFAFTDAPPDLLRLPWNREPI